MNQIDALRLIAETEPILKRATELAQLQRCNDDEKNEFSVIIGRINCINKTLSDNEYEHVVKHIDGRLRPIIDVWLYKYDTYYRHPVQKA